MTIGLRVISPCRPWARIENPASAAVVRSKTLRVERTQVHESIDRRSATELQPTTYERESVEVRFELIGIKPRHLDPKFGREIWSRHPLCG